MNKKQPIILVILDGFGHGPTSTYNPITKAHIPHLTMLFNHYPHTLLRASGTAVGLPKNYVGNSEVGHLTIGSGRIIQQPLTIINHAIANDQLKHNPYLTAQLKNLKKNNKTLHIMGLLSDGGVHSHENHLYAYLTIASEYAIPIVVHPFLDGRDTAPCWATHYLEQLETEIAKYTNVRLGSMHGRFYAMDRDNNWDRTKKSYDILTSPHNTAPTDWRTVLTDCYTQGISDEFIPPTMLTPHAYVVEGDGIISINFRPDRMRQLTACFTNPQFNQFSRPFIPLNCFITPIKYNDNPFITVLFKEPIIKNTLKEVLSQHHKTIFSIAETEKYAHVTYFFSAYYESPFPGETQTLIPSIVTESYAAYPSMSAPTITSTVLCSLKTDPADFYLINYANADMVGHSGDIEATIKSIECLDNQIKQLYEQIIETMNGTLYITADHGNAENKFDPKKQQPHTAHTRNQVPFLYIQKNKYDLPETLALTELADIAPFILKNMHLPIPAEMNHEDEKML